MSQAPAKQGDGILSLKGRTAVITGSGRNIGKEIALLLARHGANVVVNGHRDAEALKRVVSTVEAEGGSALAVLGDVSSPKFIAEMIGKARDRFGGVDIVISGVGVRKHAPFLEISAEEWQSLISQNLLSAVYLAQASLPLMMERKWGRFIVMNGIDGFSLIGGERSPMAVAKAGLLGLTRALAMEYGRYNITVNGIAPNMLSTERDWSNWPGFDVQGFIDSLPLRRMGSASDIANAALFLCSDAASFITGQSLQVNGGQHMP